MRQDPILIVGAARSGTSMVAGVLKNCGAWSGRTASGSEFNPKGYFENVELFGEIRGRMVHRETKPNERSYLTGAQSFAEDMDDIAGSSNIPSDRPWFIKMPEIVAWNESIEWPLWEKNFPHAKWIIVERDLQDIFASHNRKYGQKREGTDLIISEIPALKAHLENSSKKYFSIRPFDSMASGTEQFRDLVNFAGCRWNQQKVDAFIDPGFQHHGTSPEMDLQPA